MRVRPQDIPQDINGKDIILGAYLCNNPDPQGKATLKPDNLDYVGGWVASAARLGLNCAIMHDSLSETFIAKVHLLHKRHAKGGSLHFIPVVPKDYSPNDERFLITRELLRHCTPRAICLVDLSDARFTRTPFTDLDHPELANLTHGLAPSRSLQSQPSKYIRAITPLRILFGTEVDPIENNPWMHRQFNRILGHVPPELESGTIYNCGAICARHSDFLELMEAVGQSFEYIQKKNKLMDMSVFNHLLHARFKAKVRPARFFTSPFKDYHSDGPWSVLHK